MSNLDPPDPNQKSPLDYRGEILNDTDFSDVVLVKACFIQSILDGSNLEDNDCTGAQFHAARLRNVSLRGTKLDDASFKMADLEDAIFDRAHGHRVDLSKASLYSSSFKEAILVS